MQIPSHFPQSFRQIFLGIFKFDNVLLKIFFFFFNPFLFFPGENFMLFCTLYHHIYIFLGLGDHSMKISQFGKESFDMHCSKDFINLYFIKRKEKKKPIALCKNQHQYHDTADPIFFSVGFKFSHLKFHRTKLFGFVNENVKSIWISVLNI